MKTLPLPPCNQSGRKFFDKSEVRICNFIGAGRKFSRSEARKRFTMQDFEREMHGIECRHSIELIDEIPSAYKDIDEVMENSKSLVSILFELRQIVNIKGN